MIDPKKTTLVLDTGFAKSEHVPPWIHKKRELNQDVKEFLHLGKYDYPRL